MYRVLINTLLFARLIMANNFALNSSGDPNRVISSPRAPKHGCDPLSAAESASNGASRWTGIGAGFAGEGIGPVDVEELLDMVDVEAALLSTVDDLEDEAADDLASGDVAGAA